MYKLTSVYKKSAIIFMALAMAFASTSAFTPSADYAAAKVYKVGDRFNEKGINAGKTAYVTNLIKKDITGDKKEDQLIVVGNLLSKDSMSYDQFTYVLKDGKTGKQTSYSLKCLEYYAGWGNLPVVELVDLNNDNVQDVFFSSYSGGTGGFVYYNVATLKDGKYKQLLGQKELVGVSVTGKYVDGFKAEMTCTEINKSWTQDLSAMKSRLVEAKVYDQNGKLLTPVEPWVSPPYIKVYPGYVTGEQTLKGIANSDYIGGINVDYSYKDGKLEIMEIKVESILKSN